MQEDMGPCQYINPLLNREYLFRVLYYERRISLEVFHALTDGNGALMFLKELVYQYLRLVHPEIGKGDRMELHEETTVDREDSYLKHYKRPAKKSYKTEKALVIRGKGSRGIISESCTGYCICRMSSAWRSSMA